MDKYTLEVYEPGSKLDVWIALESDSPFISISKGEILNASFFPGAIMNDRVEVIGVEHIIWDHQQGSGSKQKVCIFTKKVVDTGA